jgi:hypothetical protein
MEYLVTFNQIKVLLTTGQNLSEVQSMIQQADVIISVYKPEDGGVKVLKP